MIYIYRALPIITLGIFMLSHAAWAQEADIYQMAGFATVNGGTTGGAGGDTLTVSSGSDLQNAINSRKNNPVPLVIIVEGTINLDNSDGLSKIDVKEVEGVTIIGSGPGADFDGIGLKIFRASNIILRNLKVHHVLSGEKDCISIEGPANHIWIDHCELFNEYPDVDKDYYDGLLDAKADCEYITYSWNFLHDSWKTALVGSSEGDIFDRKLTMHHNYFLNCNSRLPLFRASTGHFFNNYYKDIASTVINSRTGSCARIENNYFENANNPWVSAYSEILGGGEVIGNILVNSPFQYSDDTHELPVCAPGIPYLYDEVLHDAQQVPELVKACAGVGKLGLGPTLSTNNSRHSDSDIHPKSLMSLHLHPNPMSGVGRIDFLVGEQGRVILTLVGITGTEYILFNGFSDSDVTRSVLLNSAVLKPGLYMVELLTESKRMAARLVVLD